MITVSTYNTLEKTKEPVPEKEKPSNMETAKNAINNLMGYNKEEDASTTGTTSAADTTAHHTTDRTGDDTLGHVSLALPSLPRLHPVDSTNTNLGCRIPQT